MTPERALRRGGHAYPSDIINDLIAEDFIPVPLSFFDNVCTEDQKQMIGQYIAKADAARKERAALNERRRTVLNEQ